MKKTFALLLLLVLTVGLLVGCNQVSSTEKKVRWENNETWTYDISLLSSESLTTTDGTYRQDFLYSGETNPVSGELDRIVPEVLTGTYIVTLSVDTKNELTTVSTTQTMFATYSTNYLGDLTPFETAELVVEKDNSSVTLKSTTETQVVFKNNTAQTPVSAHTKVNGFYIGKQNQSVSQYEVSTTYEVGSKNTVIQITKNGETAETTVSGNNIIDTNQVLTYIRSYDKTSTSFQDSPSVMVFDPLTATTRKMTFVYTEEQNFLLKHTFAGDTESTPVATKVNRLDVLLDGMAFMTQTNLPDLTEKGLDKISSGEVIGVYAPKHTICRFRVGFVSYQLTGYLTDAMVKAIQANAE